MKNYSTKYYAILCITLFFNLFSITASTYGRGETIRLSDFKTSVGSGSGTLLIIMDYVLTVMIFGGLIPLIATFVSSGKPKMGIVYGWVSAVIISVLAKYFLHLENLPGLLQN